MWWLDPGKEVLNVVFNRILAPYVENLDMNQVNYGVSSGLVSLQGLRMKKGALDKFRLPVDVLEGHLGEFSLSLHWRNIGNQPVEILVEDVYLLVVPSTQNGFDPKEEEARAQAAKAERLENAELLHMRGQAETSTDNSPQSKGLFATLISKIINNLQITVKNVHIRYEDQATVPGHPFAVGLTLAGFKAFSVNENWEQAFIESTAGAIHKLAELQSLAVYFDTDAESMAGRPHAKFVEAFHDMISQGQGDDMKHQFILKPVSGQGRIVVNHKVDKQTPRFDVQLLFDEIGVAVDDNQYRDAISLVDMFHVYTRQHQYWKYRPSDEEFSSNAARARLRYAMTAITEGVRERNHRWTWAYFAERRDDRNNYVSLFMKKLLNTLSAQDSKELEALEKKLTYEDLRFYRSIARSRLRKDAALRKKLRDDKAKQQPTKQSWGSWIWGSSSSETSTEDPAFGGPMTEGQRKELYEALDYDEKSAVLEALQAPRDSMKTRLSATLRKGSFTLREDPRGKAQEVISVVFDVFQAQFIQRPGNFEVGVSLGDFAVYDGTTQNTLYRQIVQVKGARGTLTSPDGARGGDQQSFLSIKYENKPLDERADNALVVKMGQMEIIYHRTYVEAVYKFLKPPESQLESVEALLTAASQTLEGLSKETRAGLEFALQNHRTIDIQMDMDAPVIIVPEKVTTNHCKHLIVDAGHIAIESNLADKNAVRSIQAKRNQKYSDEDYQSLASLMYDKFSLKLKDAQFVVGDDLESCRRALSTDAGDSFHLLERTSVELLIQNSIIPQALSLARFKVSGTLPTLQVNLSDAKYKSLMRLIDVSIPRLGGDPDPQPEPVLPNLPLVPGLFSQENLEYHIEEGESDEEDQERGNPEESVDDDEQFFEAVEGLPERPELRQHIFELHFQVGALRASLSKATGENSETPLGEVLLERFALDFVLAKYDMRVDVNLRSLSMDFIQLEAKPMRLISSAEHDASPEKDLLSVTYTRVQKNSPEFMAAYEGIEQNVDVRISTFVFKAVPEPVLALYDFIMTTFVPKSGPSDKNEVHDLVETSSPANRPPDPQPEGKIRVIVKLASVQLTLINEDRSLATLSLSTADVSVLLRPKTLRITGRLGSLALSNDSDSYGLREEFSQILSIEGHNFADFHYQTFDPEEDAYSGVKSSVSLRTASLKLHYLEGPLHDIYIFLAKLVRLKGLYDAATEVAAQTASEIDLMQFEISVKSPIVIFPSDPAQSPDTMVLRLGEISAQNDGKTPVNRIAASLRGIQLASNLYHNGQLASLRIIDDIDIVGDISQTVGIDRSQDKEHPDVQISVNVSDIRLQLTQIQYRLLVNLSRSIPRVLAGAPEGASQAEERLLSPAASSNQVTLHESATASTDLEPEIRPMQTSGAWNTVDLVVTAGIINLKLFGEATHESTLKENSIARFSLNNNTLRFKMFSDGAGEAQLILKSFTMSNTRPGNSKFREIIPAARHDRDQFMILYTMSGGSSGNSLAIVTIDSPQVVFAVDPIFALVVFFTSIEPSAAPATASVQTQVQTQATEQDSQSSLDFRIDLHDISISVLENDTNPDSQAIQLSISQLLLSQQSVMALTINRLGMSLMQMGRPNDSVRFLDDVDLTFTLDSRSTSSQQVTSIEISSKPIVFRASYRDINLITTIVNKAIELSNRGSQSAAIEGEAMKGPQEAVRAKSRSLRSSSKSRSHSQPMGKARVVMSKEQLKASFDGFRLVLIGDLHEQPMLHLKVKPFIIGAKDWSAELHATTTMAIHISYWNLTNSHWEPLIDPWTFTTTVEKAGPSGALALRLSSREQLDLNLSTTFAELAMASLKVWSKEGQEVLQSARGSYAPYRIRNRTGSPIFVWSDADGNNSSKDTTGQKILSEQSVEWRFDDWKTMREHVSSSSQHTIGLQFVGKPWEQLRGIPVDKEGEYVFALRPRTDEYAARVLCEVRVVDNVKMVTIRSTYKVENQTLYPLELTLVDEQGHPAYSLEKVLPGQDYALPLEAVHHTRIRIQPDQGFGYKWCSALRWEDLVAKKGFTIKCPHTDAREAAFRFQAWVHAEQGVSNKGFRGYPKIHLKLRAPIELENLLPYNLQYRVYDKDTDQNWRSYLRQGGVMPVHSVELGHLVLLNVEVQDTAFKPSEFAIISTDRHSDFEQESKLSLRDGMNRTLDLKLNYVRYPDAGGAFKVQIYNPFVVVNKTGLPLFLRSKSGRSTQDVAGENRSDILSTPTPLMASHHHRDGKEFIVKFGQSAWSKPFSVDAVAATTPLVINQPNGMELHVGLAWTQGLGKYKLSKVITFTPRFIIKNELGSRISFREHGVPPNDRPILEHGQTSPLLFLRPGPSKLITIAFPGLNSSWSPAINIEDIGSIHFRLREPGGERSDIQLIRADVKVGDESTVFISFHSAPNAWPFIIENSSDYLVLLSQKRTDAGDARGLTGKDHPEYTLSPHSVTPYAWDFPADREKKIVLAINGIRRAVDIMEIGDLVPFKFHDGQRTKAVSLDVRADGPKQILRITNYNPEVSLYKMKARNSLGPSRQDTISSSAEAFEAVTEEVAPTLGFSVDFAGIGISLVNRNLIEVIYLSMNSLAFEYTSSEVAQAVTLSCGTLQVDNQLHDAIYPVILQPTPIPKESTGIAALPTVQASVIWLNDQEHGVFFIKYLSILLQALTIEVDEDLLYNIYELSQIKGASWEEDAQDVLIQDMNKIPEPKDEGPGQSLYFEVLELQPIKLSISFMRTERANSPEKTSLHNPFALLLDALTMTLGNINDAPLELNALAIKDIRTTTSDLQGRILLHYKQDILRQVYRIIGSADFIGNPVGLFTNVSSGVADIFYEPFNGVVMHGNKELGVGIAKGAASFAKKTIFGLSDTVTKFTSSVGKGISAATFDSEYQTRRRINQRRNKPRHAIYGIAAGGEAFATSMASAVEGVVTKPLEGAESEGALGFFKGMGKGVVGVVTKPMVGALDFVSNVSGGIRNTTTVFDNPARDRVRLPRLVPADGVLRPYSSRDAMGQYWMKDLNEGQFRNESYVAHINTPGSDNVVLLTASRIVSFWSKKLRLEWDLPFTQVQGVAVEDTGIRFAHKAGKDHDKFVFIPDKSSQSWFFDKVAGIVKAFNLRQRMQ